LAAGHFRPTDLDSQVFAVYKSCSPNELCQPLNQSQAERPSERLLIHVIFCLNKFACVSKAISISFVNLNIETTVRNSHFFCSILIIQLSIKFSRYNHIYCIVFSN
jgi:hypothetical protein